MHFVHSVFHCPIMQHEQLYVKMQLFGFKLLRESIYYFHFFHRGEQDDGWKLAKNKSGGKWGKKCLKRKVSSTVTHIIK